MAKMSERFMSAAGVGTGVEGLLKTLPPQGQELLQKMTAALVSQFQAAPGVDKAAVTNGAPVTVS